MKQQKLTGYQPNYPRKVLQGAALTAATLLTMGSMVGCRQAKVPELQIDGAISIEPPTWQELVLDGEVAIPEPTEEPVLQGKFPIPTGDEVLVTEGEIAVPEPDEDELVLSGDIAICEPTEDVLRTEGVINIPEEN